MSKLRPLAREVIIKTLSKLSIEQVNEIGGLVIDEVRRKLGIETKWPPSGKT